jgi:hypothetical protein
MKLNKYKAILLLVSGSFLFFGCGTKDNLKKIDLPQPQTLYFFPFQSEVDALSLGCGYRSYEKWGDWVKKEIRKATPNLTNQDLIRMGKEIHNSFPYPITNSHPKTKWAKQIIKKMRPYLVEKSYNHEVFILEADFLNAFTAPGGNIYVTTSMLDALSSEDELAFVIGHELGHNENDHTRELGRLYSFCTQSEGSLFPTLRAAVLAYGEHICGKSDELECDVSSLYLMAKAGYDPEKAENVFNLFLQYDTPKPNNEWYAWYLEILRSHPWSENRISCVKDQTRNAKVVSACDPQKDMYSKTLGKVITKTDPLNIREYPTKLSKSLYKIPKGATVQLVCDCAKQNYDHAKDWIYVGYFENNNLHKGWVDKKFIGELTNVDSE